MCLIGVKETYVHEKKKVTKNFWGQICTTVSGLKWGSEGASSASDSSYSAGEGVAL